MAETQVARTPGVYDHESDQPLGRSRRAPDWGGDELFTTMPVRRRRFGQAAAPARSRREEPHAPAGRRSAPAVPEPSLDARAELAAEPAADEPGTGTGAAASAPAAASTTDTAGFAPVTGRRTVQIGGRPGEGPAFAPARRRRSSPSPSIGDRVGGRPDRVAGWACGLGVLLILVAVSTADAAPL